MSLSPSQIVRALELEPHPEGGHFRETWRHDPGDGSRGAGTAIYYLLERGEISRWHRVDSAEIWHHYAGDPLELSISEDGGRPVRHVLGPDLAAGNAPQVIVPAGAWQSARPLGAFALCGCTVAPAFEFDRFELAPEGWEPGSP